MGAESLSKKMPRDGVALIYNLHRVTVCGAPQRIESDSNAEAVFGLAVPLEAKSDGRRVLFVATHLKSTKSAEGEAQRARQIRCLLSRIERSEEMSAVVLCCDLNANPTTNEKGYAPECYRVLTGEFGFESA